MSPSFLLKRIKVSHVFEARQEFSASVVIDINHGAYGCILYKPRSYRCHKWPYLILYRYKIKPSIARHHSLTVEILASWPEQQFLYGIWSFSCLHCICPRAPPRALHSSVFELKVPFSRGKIALLCFEHFRDCMHWKSTQCGFENLTMCPGSYKNNILKISNS